MSGPRISVAMLLLCAVTLPVGVVLSTHLARSSFEKVKLRDQTVTVKGYAERPITSDLAKWGATVTTRKPDLVAAYDELERGRGKLLRFLDAGGFKDAAVWASPVSIAPRYRKDQEGRDTNAIESYVLRQAFVVSGGDVGRVAKIARDASDLIRDGVELEAEAPTYLCTKLDEAKLEMISEAVANARARAESLVKGSRSKLGALRSASQGVFQITPLHTTDVSGGGINDTSSIEKVVKAVVTQEYAID